MFGSWDAGGGCHQPVTGVQNQLVNTVSTILGVSVFKARSKSFRTYRVLKWGVVGVSAKISENIT